ncbi:aminotransferase [Epibacterium ulvae]|uniref:aminotransferase n=1 Tax=Epibacterium ulvae TaxID=1156985 RepID=UPI001BFCB0ED|nr:aminotransferase [Epibacterium ulvae]MBT8152442.1 aminotransferase [Epibacterium ulvae]
MATPRTQRTFSSPIVESRRWLEGVTFSAERPLLNLSQAAPADIPPEALRQVMAEAALHDTSAHLYGAVLGRDALRVALATQISNRYDGSVLPAHVGITSGANQAFAATIASLCDEGDEVILPTPWYFNHKMALDLAGVSAVPLPVGAGMLPDVVDAEQRITSKTRAMVLITPNNPCGVEYPEGLVETFFDLAKRHNLALILDETYRDFDLREGAPHKLFQKTEWDQNLIHLYSFSKAYRLTGHRVGAIVTGALKLFEIEKFLDTHTICPSQIGQIAATWGIENLSDWLAGERAEILSRRAAIENGFSVLAERGWKLLGSGAYFAYVEHPFPQTADDLAKQLIHDCGVLMLPGTMFTPSDDPSGARQFRIAFANVDASGIAELFDRLAAWTPEGP